MPTRNLQQWAVLDFIVSFLIRFFYFHWLPLPPTKLELSIWDALHWSQKFMMLNLVFFTANTPKDWGLETNTNLNSIFCLVKSSYIILIFLPAFYLIMCLMTHQRILKKNSFLKIWQMIFLWGVITCFEKLPLKWCTFSHRKNLQIHNAL